LRKIIIDTDTATDDAVALIMALKHTDFDIKAITTVAGNVDLEQATQNALYTVELCNRKIPVFKGSSCPLSRKLETSKFFHGKDGLGDSGPYIPKINEENKDAVSKIVSLIKKYPHEIEIIAIGPLTNIAKVFQKDPSLIHTIKSLYVMGGIGEGKGNITEHAEFNFWVDPDAADYVLNSSIEVHLIAWDTTQIYGFLDKENFNELERINTPLSQFAINIQQKGLEYYKIKYKEHKIDLADPLAMAAFIDNEIVTKFINCNIKIITNGDKRGKDILSLNSSGNIKLASKISRYKFLNNLKKSLV
jgi:purine nucleosidase|tara:strand:- start:1089 stop:2000 length:912 start_codon:yes stop_codon:yes gene_type:complete